MMWNIFRWRSLKTRVTLLTLAIFVSSIWALTFYVSRILREDMQRLSAEQQFSTTSFIAAEINGELSDRLTALEEYAAIRLDPSVLGNPAALQTRLEGSPVMQSMFNAGIFVTRPDGTAIASVPPTYIRVGLNYSDRDYIITPTKEGKSAIGKPRVGVAVKAPIIAMSAPIRDAKGNLIGVLVGVTDLTKPNFLDKVTHGGYGKTGGFMLIAPKDRLIVTASLKSRVMETVSPPGSIPTMDRFIQGYEGSAVYVNRFGIESLTSTKRIPVADWFVAVDLPTDESFAPIRDMQQRILLATLFLTLLVGGLIWWILRRQLSPLLATASAMAALSDSNQIPPPLAVLTRDEVGQLSIGFNRLIETWTRRETALRESEARFRNYFNQPLIGVAVTSPDEGWIEVNTRLCEMLGYLREEIVQLTWAEITHPDDTAGDVAQLERVLRGEIDGYSLDKRLVRKDGTMLHVAMSVSCERTDAGRVDYFVALIDDITKRFQLEALLRESQKMEALGTLAGGVAHDFNNALAAIIGNVALARQDVGPGHAALESLEEIGKASRRAKALVQQILAFGRRQTTERKVISLEPIAQETAKFLRSTIPAGISLNVECAPEIPSVLADARQIEQVLINLGGNAWQSIEGQERAGLIEIQLEAELRGGLRFAVLTVRDNGQGMDEATRARIFEPFFTTKAVDKGTGLGLSVVYGIVQAHAADIEVRSTPGEGTAFVIRFPAAKPPAALVPEKDGDASVTDVGAPLALQSEGKRVLYVDDEECIVSLMTRLLGRRGYRVTGYTEPRKALEAVRANPDHFDLAVTDYNMPGMSGLEVARTLREIRADLPVILVSGYINEELQREAPAAGVRELIFKAGAVEEVCEAVARYANAKIGKESSS